MIIIFIYFLNTYFFESDTLINVMNINAKKINGMISLKFSNWKSIYLKIYSLILFSLALILLLLIELIKKEKFCKDQNG